MNHRLLKIYHRMPAALRILPVYLRGLYLRNWRFGPETERLISEAQEREYWDKDRLLNWQQERLAKVLHRAATRVPFYREQWAVRRKAGDRSSWELLENWPILEKENLRKQALAFVADDCDVRQLFHDHTSGTTGKSLDLWASRKTTRELYALFETRGRLRYGVSRHDRWAMVGGQLVTPVTIRKPPFWVWNPALNQLYMSSYHLAPDLIGHYLDALVKYNITNLIGYTSSLYALAQEALRSGRTELKLKVAITNAEPVFDYQRQAISKAFNCPVRETYGMAEAVAAATECEHGKLHLWPELGWMEVCDGDTPVGSGQTGDLVATGLLNMEMPLIRYRIGDRGSLANSLTECACGRMLPVLDAIEGRADDVLYTVDGRQIGRLDPVFKSQLPVHEAQIIQESYSRIRVRYVPTEAWHQRNGNDLISRLRERMGNVEVVLEPLSEIPRLANGKFRAVICQIQK
ncbi:MAG TPA: hypothetical protein VEF04_12615 [Blastocatellia bacterium]|nr:hypothetical protein [Blastocatellia bacterium]